MEQARKQASELLREGSRVNRELKRELTERAHRERIQRKNTERAHRERIQREHTERAQRVLLGEHLGEQANKQARRQEGRKQASNWSAFSRSHALEGLVY